MVDKGPLGRIRELLALATAATTLGGALASLATTAAAAFATLAGGSATAAFRGLTTKTSSMKMETEIHMPKL